MIPASTTDMTAAAAAKDQTVTFPVTPSGSNSDIVPSGAPTFGDGDELKPVSLTISKVKRAKPITWTGEEQLSVRGVLNNIVVDQYTQRMRSLVNEIEEDLALEATREAIIAGNFYGTSGTTPFNGSINDLADGLKMLIDNGAPKEDLQFVINTSAGANMRKIMQLTSVNQAGENDLLRRGELGNIFGFQIRESAGFRQHARGTGSGYLVNGTPAIGATTIPIDTGSGTIRAGTIITFAGDTTQYSVVEDVQSGGTTLKISKGLVKAPANDSAITLGVSYLPNVAFSKGSIILVTRTPAVPDGGDNALDRTIITDPLSGLSFEVSLWGGYRQNQVEIALAWGVKNIKPEHTLALLG